MRAYKTYKDRPKRGRRRRRSPMMRKTLFGTLPSIGKRRRSRRR